ncbi:MAG TPA: hypothetical protein DCQ97_10560 [Chitinophagaceae bacterium]|nr:hypothetical protein [Chitinophagaceae bacterium]
MIIYFVLEASKRNTAPSGNGIQKYSNHSPGWLLFFPITYMQIAARIQSRASNEYIFFLFMIFGFYKATLYR